MWLSQEAADKWKHLLDSLNMTKKTANKYLRPLLLEKVFLN